MKSTRKYARYNCSGAADLVDDTANTRCWGEIGDISMGGFYMSTFGPWPIATQVRFKLDIAEKQIFGSGVVATSHPGVGMAVMYRDLGEEDKAALEIVIARLESGPETAESGMHA
jgi:hypothetical protein